MKSTHFVLSPFVKKDGKHLEVFYHKIGLRKRYRHPNRLLVRKVFLQSWWRILHSEWLNQSFCEIICINKKLRSTAAVIDSPLLKVVRSLDRSILMKFTYHHVDFGKGLLIPNYHLTVCASMNLKSNLNFRAAKNFHFADCRKMILGVNSKSPTDNVNFFGNSIIIF